MKKAMPATDSINELAKFWDTHDLTDFESKVEEVKDTIFEHGIQMNVQLEANEFQSLELIARKKGVSDSELVHEWIREKLQAA